jgi:decaprenyl-phosphate phosphoribosyltransferase
MSVAPERPATPAPGDARDARQPGEPAASAASPTPPLVVSLLRAARPRQWVKNVLVFAAPGAAGVLTQANDLLATVAAFVAFCLAASATYFLNDALDAEADRRHPTKRDRPIAAGLVSPRLAYSMSGVLAAVAIAVAAPFNSGALALVIGGYLVITASYCLWLKHEPVLDIGAVAAGFVLRAVAGAAATGVEVSDWFLIVAGAGSLLMVTGKRFAEQVELGEAVAHHHRRTLGVYSPSFLNYVRAVASGVAMTAYCLWAFERAEIVGDEFWFHLSVVPFVLAVLRYALVVEQGGGGAPEEVVLSDRVLQVLGVLWVVTFAVGVHA